MASLLHNTTMLFGNDPFNHDFVEFGEQMLLHLRYVPTIALAGHSFLTHDSPYLMLYPVNAMCDDRGYNLFDKQRLVQFGNCVLEELQYRKRLHIVYDVWGIPRIRAYFLAPQVAHPPANFGGIVIYNGVADGGQLVVNEQDLEIFNGEDAHQGEEQLLLQDHAHGNNVLNPMPLFAVDEDGQVVDFDGRRTRLLNLAVLAAIADLFVQRNPTTQAPLTRQEIHQHVVNTLINRYGIGPSGINLEDRYMVSLVDNINAMEPVIVTMQKYLVVPGPGNSFFLDT